MRRVTAWMGGVAGGIAAYRLFRRRTQAAPGGEPPPAPAEPDDRAEELRAKLADSRVAEPSAEAVATEAPAVEPVEREADQPAAEEAGGESPDERRRRVHEEGRGALDEMQSE